MKRFIKAIGCNPIKLVAVSCGFDMPWQENCIVMSRMRAVCFFLDSFIAFLVYIHIYVFLSCNMVAYHPSSSFWPAFECRLGTQPISRGCHQIIMCVQTHISDLIPLITLCAASWFSFSSKFHSVPCYNFPYRSTISSRNYVIKLIIPHRRSKQIIFLSR